MIKRGFLSLKILDIKILGCENMAYQIESIKETESKVDIILHYSKQKCKLLLLVKIFILKHCLGKNCIKYLFTHKGKPLCIM